MLQQLHADWVSKYSFIDSAVIEGTKFLITYTKKGKQVIVKIPRRSNKEKLQQVIQGIRKTTGVSKYGKGNVSDIYIV